MSEITDPSEYLKSRRMFYIQKVENIAEKGTIDDRVKLDALKALMAKSIPDQTKVEVSATKSPWEILQDIVGGEKDSKEAPEMREKS